jgi:pre-mRNA-splicing factor CWC22
MDSKRKSKQEINLESPEADTRSRYRERAHFSSSDTGIKRYLAGKKREGYDDGKKRGDREDRQNHHGLRKRSCDRYTILDEERSGKERKRKKREEGEEIKIGSGMSYHKDENESSYSRRRGNGHNRDRDSKYQNERFDKYDRYWNKNNTGYHCERENSDHNWRKYPATEGKRSRDGDDENTSRGGEKKVEGYDSGNRNSKQDLQEDTQQKRTVDLLTSRTGGAYIPPAKLRMMQAQITDKSSAAYQRVAWEALKKSIHGLINKINIANIGIIVRELLKENIVRGRGLLCRSIIQAQAASTTFTHVYAALVAVINCKVRLVQQFVQCELDLEVFL